jgi:hypothetical protein
MNFDKLQTPAPKAAKSNVIDLVARALHESLEARKSAKLHCRREA